MHIAMATNWQKISIVLSIVLGRRKAGKQVHGIENAAENRIISSRYRATSTIRSYRSNSRRHLVGSSMTSAAIVDSLE
jgi:hypothetical protein